jgi:hypothetical protein
VIGLIHTYPVVGPPTDLAGRSEGGDSRSRVIQPLGLKCRSASMIAKIYLRSRDGLVLVGRTSSGYPD